MEIAKMSPWKARVVGGIAVYAGIVAWSGTPTHAEPYWGGMVDPDFCVQYQDVNDTWAGPMNNGRLSWNNRSTIADISEFSGCTNTFHVGIYGDTWLGVHKALIPGLQYQIQLDSGSLNDHINDSGYQFSNVVQSTTVHDFGHGLRLGHVDQTYSIMSHDRNRNVVFNPHSSDLDNVIEYYP